MATENILMAAVAAGGDRQDLHERIRRHSQAAAAVVKERGGRNDLLDRLAGDPAFAKVDLATSLDPARIRRPRAGTGRRVSGRRRRPDPQTLRHRRQPVGRNPRVTVRCGTGKRSLPVPAGERAFAAPNTADALAC